MKDLFMRLQMFFVCAALLLTGCENGNLFGRLNDRGDSSDPKVLVSQGYDALREGNYGEALNLFNKALSKSPNNAQALYGAATAQLAGSGLNLGALISNLTNQTSSSLAVQDLGSLIRQSRVSISAVHTTPNSILQGIDLEALGNAVDKVICRLQKIVSGASDGSIAADDVDVLLNLATISIIGAVVVAIDADFFDITNVNGHYSVVTEANFNDGFCSGHQATIESIGGKIVDAWHLFNKAAVVLNLSGNPIIVQLKNDVDEAIENMFDEMDPGLPSCLTILNGMGISPSGGFKNPSATAIFTPNGNTCN